MCECEPKWSGDSCGTEVDDMRHVRQVDEGDDGTADEVVEGNDDGTPEAAETVTEGLVTSDGTE